MWGIHTYKVVTAYTSCVCSDNLYYRLSGQLQHHEHQKSEKSEISENSEMLWNFWILQWRFINNEVMGHKSPPTHSSSHLNVIIALFLFLLVCLSYLREIVPCFLSVYDLPYFELSMELVLWPLKLLNMLLYPVSARMLYRLLHSLCFCYWICTQCLKVDYLSLCIALIVKQMFVFCCSSSGFFHPFFSCLSVVGVFPYQKVKGCCTDWRPHVV